MGKANLVHRKHGETKSAGGMISGRLAYRYLRLSDRVFFPAVKHRVLVPQMMKPLGKRTEYHFSIAYLDEVAKILPKERQKGLEVFTEPIVARLASINKEWDGKMNVDWAKDAKDTERVMKLIGKKR